MSKQVYILQCSNPTPRDIPEKPSHGSLRIIDVIYHSSISNSRKLEAKLGTRERE